jgi:hypothetical protein
LISTSDAGAIVCQCPSFQAVRLLVCLVPSKIIIKLGALDLNSTLCNLVLDILIGCHQVVKVGNSTSTMQNLNTGPPHGCVLSPLLSSLFTHDCVAMQTSNSIKFADDTTVVGLITNNDETAYREEEIHSKLCLCAKLLKMNLSFSSSRAHRHKNVKFK